MYLICVEIRGWFSLLPDVCVCVCVCARVCVCAYVGMHTCEHVRERERILPCNYTLTHVLLEGWHLNI